MRNERGAVAVLFALLLPVLVMIAALVIDTGWLQYNRIAAQNAADAGALAAAQSCSTAAGDEADQANTLAEANWHGGAVVMTPCTTDVTVTVSKDVPTILAGIFGRSAVTVSARAVASWSVAAHVNSLPIVVPPGFTGGTVAFTGSWSSFAHWTGTSCADVSSATLLSWLKGWQPFTTPSTPCADHNIVTSTMRTQLGQDVGQTFEFPVGSQPTQNSSFTVSVGEDFAVTLMRSGKDPVCVAAVAANGVPDANNPLFCLDLTPAQGAASGGGVSLTG